MPDPTNDIDELLRLWSESARSDHRRYHRALTALVAERDALKQRVAELEAQPPTSDLRERLVCAALTGLSADPNMNVLDTACVAVEIADATLAAMRKGDSDGK